ncbi:MAG TPA: TIGR03790 family protein, partial [Planctomycetia bacterium]|nr:TIGR03790 family protein [Planctomycetia bacterium]
MIRPRFNLRREVAALIAALHFVGGAVALGPHQVLVLVRKDDPDGLRVANHFRVVRGVPPEQFVHLSYSGSPWRCDWAQFEREILRPARDHVERRGLRERICCWVTTPGLPYRVGDNGISGAIHFGAEEKAVNSPSLGPAGFKNSNAYFDQFVAIDGFAPGSRAPKRPLHMHLAGPPAGALVELIDRAKRVDGTSPAGTVYLCEGDGPRGSRRGTIPGATRLLDALFIPNRVLPAGTFTGKSDILGLFTGVVAFPIEKNVFVPGALADHLTSCGGMLADPQGQRLAQDFLPAGCVATYGAVVEPYNYPQKFPAAMVHPVYAAGFTAAEAYWMCVAWPQQGLFQGDPLARPFGKGPSIAIASPRPSQEFGNELAIDVSAELAGPGAGVAALELWIDGRRIAFLGQRGLPTDVELKVEVGGKSVTQKNPTGATLAQMLQQLQRQLAAADIQARIGPSALFLFRRPGDPSMKLAAS